MSLGLFCRARIERARRSHQGSAAASDLPVTPAESLSRVLGSLVGCLRSRSGGFLRTYGHLARLATNPGEICGLGSRALLIAISLFALSGCPKGPPPLPTIEGVLLPANQRDAILRELQSQSEHVHSFKTLSRLTMQNEEGAFTLRAAILFERPDRLRIELFPLTSFTTLSLLVAREGRFSLIEQDREQPYQGDQRLLARILGLSVDVERFASIIASFVPVTSNFEDYKVYLSSDSLTLSIVLRDFESYWVLDRPSKIVKHVEYRDPYKGRLRAVINYGAMRAFEGAALPGEIDLYSPEESRRFLLKMTSPQVNSEIRSDLFEVTRGVR